MNLLFILDNYYPFRGGAETLFRNLCEGLAKKGNKVTVLTQRVKGSKSQESLNGVEIHRISAGNRYLFTFAAIPKAISLGKKADIIHTTTFNSALAAFIAAKFSGKKSVITIHEVWLWKWHVFTDMNFISSFLHSLLELPIYLLSFDKYVCVSGSTRKSLVESCPWIPKKKTTVIYNGLDYNHFNPKKEGGTKIRKKLGLGNDFVALCYGRAAPSKGFEYAAQSASHVKLKNFRWLFIITPDYGERFKKVVSLVKTSDNSILLGPVDYSELPSYLAAVNCVVIPSLSEGFGYSAAESCAMDKIVLASNITSLPEIVSGKFNLFPPKNPRAIAKAVEDASKGKFQKSSKKAFTIEQNVQSHALLYKELR